MAHKDESGAERVSGVGIEGEHEATFVMRLLTTGRVDLGAASSGDSGSSLEE